MSAAAFLFTTGRSVLRAAGAGGRRGPVTCLAGVDPPAVFPGLDGGRGRCRLAGFSMRF